MQFDDHTPNFAYSLVATAPSPAASGLTLVVTAGQGSRFPTPPFNATIWPTSSQPTPANAEIVRVTAISTDTLIIKRAQESTSARTIIIGDQIAATVTAKTFTDLEAGFSPDLALSVMVAAKNTNTIPAATSAYVCSDLEISKATYADFTDTGGSNTSTVGVVYGTPVTLPSSTFLTAIFVRSAAGGFAATGHMRVGVYADSAGAPGALLASSTSVAFGTTDTSIRFPLAVTEIGGSVWIGMQADAAAVVAASSIGEVGEVNHAFASYASGLPNPFGAPTATGEPLLAFDALAEAVVEIGAGALLEIG